MCGTFEEPPTGLIPWFSKTEGNTYATLLHHPFLFKGKPTHAQEVARRISGAVAGEAYTKSSQDLISRQRAISDAVAGEIYTQVKTYQVPITNSYPSHYIICHLPLVFLSPTSPLSFYSPSLLGLPLFVRFSLTMSEPKRVGVSLPSFSALDNPAILSKLMNRNAIEQLAGVINGNLSNFDEDDSGIFCYLLDESLKDAWYRLLRIRASYVPQYQIEV